MILHEFPDLTWLKSQTASGFSNRMGWGNHRLDTEGFPSVIIHTNVASCFRPDIKGPLSFFLNIRGNSVCNVDRQRTHINEENYFVSNRAQHYTLQVEEPCATSRRGSPAATAPMITPTATARAGRATTETFNIHFGDFFSESVLNSLLTPPDKILDKGTEKQLTPFLFFNQLHRRDATFNALVRSIMQTYKASGFNRLLFDEQLTALLSYHLLQHRHVLDTVNKLPPVRQATRVELYKRLSRAKDLLHSHYDAGHAVSHPDSHPDGEISLDLLSAEACLSKYHFLRLFRQAYGLSPHQYIQQLRLEKGKRLLVGSKMPISDLADLLGFANSQSFSRLFFQRTGLYPSQYRTLAK